MKTIYFLKGGYRNLFFSSLENACKYLINEFTRLMSYHNQPNYFLSVHPNPKSWIENNNIRIYKSLLNEDRNMEDVCKEEIIKILEKLEKEI